VIATAIAVPAAAASTGTITFRTAWVNTHGDVSFELTIAPEYLSYLDQANIHIEDSNGPVGITTVSPQTSPQTGHIYVVRMQRLTVDPPTITISLVGYAPATTVTLPRAFPALPGEPALDQ